MNWDAEKAIWDRVFSPEGMNVSKELSSTYVRLLTGQVAPQETSLLVTEPYFNLPNIAETYDQMVFEEWEFASYFRTTRKWPSIWFAGSFADKASRSAHSVRRPVRRRLGHPSRMRHRCGRRVLLHPRHPSEGWSGSMGACQAVCIAPSKRLENHAAHTYRIDVGGKLLTNHLKHLISFRQWNMSDETAVVNAVREACSYVSMDWKRDLELCKWVTIGRHSTDN